MILGIDAGNYETKVANQEGVHKFRSLLGEYRERNFDSTYGDDMVYEYKGERGMAGDIVAYECDLPREFYGSTKAHKDAMLRTLIAIHRYGGEVNDIIVGQPIMTHTPSEKSAITEMLTGHHTLTINDVTKTFEIRNVGVAAEGAISYWAYEGLEQELRFIDVGSGTINCASVHKGRFVDRDSFTIEYGVNSVRTSDFKRLCEAIIAQTSKRWKRNDVVRVCGGIAEAITPYLQQHFTNIEAMRPWDLAPVYANAIGCYELARVLYESKG